ncbi:MAG: hypothetical protein QHI48_10235 [Bacteroidota bacterium]|nr:hypothetical protein [Bacteroidota bacterium]
MITARPVRVYLGALLGRYWYMHEGSFAMTCDCRFRDADGSRAVPGVVGIVHFPKLNVAASLAVRYLDFSSVFRYRESRWTIIEPDSLLPSVDTLIAYEKMSDVRLRTLRFTPSVSWYVPRTSVYLMGGIDLGWNIEASYDNEERVLTPGFGYRNGTPRDTLLARCDIPGGKRLAVGLQAGAGVEIHLTPWFMIVPRAHIAVPLTAVSSTDRTWRVVAAQADLLLLVRL